MTERLKRWESPRHQGRNDKGKGGSARAKQLRKQQQMLRKKLKSNPKDLFSSGRDLKSLPFFCLARHEKVANGQKRSVKLIASNFPSVSKTL